MGGGDFLIAWIGISPLPLPGSRLQDHPPDDPKEQPRWRGPPRSGGRMRVFFCSTYALNKKKTLTLPSAMGPSLSRERERGFGQVAAKAQKTPGRRLAAGAIRRIDFVGLRFVLKIV